MDKLRVGIVVNQHYQPESGGGYSYYHILLDAINAFDFAGGVEIVNVILYSDKKPDIQLKKPSIFLRNGFIGPWKKLVNRQVLKRFGLDYIKQNLIGNYVFSASRGKNERRLEHALKEQNIHLLYYLNPVDRVLNFPFIMTHWDVGHRSTYPFPYLAMHGIYETRENYYNYVLNKALLVLCESQSGARELLHYYQFYADKIKVLPLFGGLILDTRVTVDRQQRILEKYSLKKQRFFLYPAQFWPHKNHYNLVMAFYELQKLPGNEESQLVLCGSDKGNMGYIWEVIKDLSLDKKVTLTGFIADEELHTLYENALAMVMPTFLGPTNLPLIEAAWMKCPIICSDFEGHREILGDTALYVDPKDPTAIAAAMEQMMNAELRERLAAASYLQIKNSPFNIHRNMQRLQEIFDEAIGIRKVWGN